MTNQNNAAQAAEKAIRAAITLLDGDLDHENAETMRALLSQVRAPVADEDDQPTAPDDDAIAECWVNASDIDGIAYDGPSFERGYRAALASAPEDPEAAEVDFLVRVLESLDTWHAEEWSELLERRPAILALLRPMVLASAPVATQRPTASAEPWKPLWDDIAESAGTPTAAQMKEWAWRLRRCAALASAPVAGEAQPEAKLQRMFVAACEALGAVNEKLGLDPNDGEPDAMLSAIDELLARAARAAPQASEAVRWVVTDDMRAAVRFAPHSAHWSERLKEFFGPDAREEIDALEKQLREARAMLDRQQPACTCHPDDRPAGDCQKQYAAAECQQRADESAVRRALAAASNYIDKLGGDSKSYRAALSATQAGQGERDA